MDQVKAIIETYLSTNDRLDYWIKELKKVGVTRYLLWEEFREAHFDDNDYSQFCERFSKSIGRRDLTMVLEHELGVCLQIDFAESKMQCKRSIKSITKKS